MRETPSLVIVSLFLMLMGMWYFYHMPFGVKKDLAGPVPFSDWAIQPRNDDDDDPSFNK